MVPVGPGALAGIGSVAVTGGAHLGARRPDGRPADPLRRPGAGLRHRRARHRRGVAAHRRRGAELRDQRCAGGGRHGPGEALPRLRPRVSWSPSAIAAIGALATVGFEPTIDLLRFEYVTLVLVLAGCFGVVYRLGAGFHGLGRRGVAIGADRRPPSSRSPSRTPSCCAATAPRDWSTTCSTASRWSRENLGAFPRPHRDRARRPGARLGHPHARPAPPGLVGLRVRRPPRPRRSPTR